MGNLEQVSSDVLSRIKEQASKASWPYLLAAVATPMEILALVECAERLKLVIAADDKAVAELTEMGLMPTDSEYFSLVEGNKAAIAKLEAL